MLKIESMKVKRDEWTSPEINFRLSEGETGAIIGPSGSGKTSIQLSIIGFLPYEGSIKYRGMEVNSIDNRYLRSRVAYVPDEPESYILNNKVFDEVAFGPENLRWPPEEVIKSSIEALEIVGLISLHDREVSSLSGGQKQRLAIADALSIKPELLLLDNPFSNIDWEARRSISKILEELCSRGLSILLTGYSLEEICLKPDRILPIGEVGKPYAGKPSNIRTLTSEKLLEVGDIWFSYHRGEHVLKGVCFTAHKGEVISIIGRNGSGKTTLLKILAGIYKPSRGVVSILGRRPRPALSIYVSQNPSIFLTGQTAREEFSEMGSLKALSLIEEIGLSHLLDKSIHKLSLGEKRIISILSALYKYPKLLCLDEPTSGLDYNLGERIGETIKLAAAKGTAVIIATHDISFAKAFSDRILLLENGVLHEEWRERLQVQ